MISSCVSLLVGSWWPVGVCCVCVSLLVHCYVLFVVALYLLFAFCFVIYCLVCVVWLFVVTCRVLFVVVVFDDLCCRLFVWSALFAFLFSLVGDSCCSWLVTWSLFFVDWCISLFWCIVQLFVC